MAVDYLVQEEDGTSRFDMEESVEDELLLEEATEPVEQSRKYVRTSVQTSYRPHWVLFLWALLRA